MLRFTTLIAVSFAVAQPAFAAASPVLAATATEYGEGDGERFAYTTELRADGFIHIAGVMLGSKQRFALDVSPNGQVDGNFGNVAVEYSVSKKVRDAVAAQLVERRVLASAN